MTSVVTAEEVHAFLKTAFSGSERAIPEITHLEKDKVIVRLEANEASLRPGGYVSGPTQMALADHVAYIAIFTRLGIVPMAVTSNLNINFLRPCIGEAVEAHARNIKFGKTLVVTEVEIKASGSDKVASHAIVTYAIPQSS